MQRDALTRFLRRVVLASPLIAGGCQSLDSDCVSKAYTDPNASEQFALDAGACNPGIHCGIFAHPCGRAADTCTFEAGDGGLVAVCHYPEEHHACNRNCTGRRPHGLREPASRPAPSALGAHFASVAFLEAASVEAFRRLRAELTAHGAPTGLRVRAERAARDEIRHARITAALARRHGGEPPPVEIEPGELRSLEEVARENAVEGCVMETFGAAVGLWQSRRAVDPVIRGAMRVIAADERRHAELAWAVDRWARGRLSPAVRARVSAARRRAVTRLAGEVLRPAPGAVAAAAGLPSTAEALALFEMAREEIWSAA